ncbi:MAG: hypothetical protein ACRC62_37595 [Microcoleus sp.]
MPIQKHPVSSIELHNSHSKNPETGFLGKSLVAACQFGKNPVSSIGVGNSQSPIQNPKSKI